MKKLNRLFAILIAVVGVSSLSAQTWTDVTSTYIKNPTLIASFYNSSDNTAWPVYTTGRGSTQHPKEWILHTNGTKNHNIGGAFFESWNTSSTTIRWTLFQDITLPAGKYQLTGKYSTDQSRGIIKTVAITPHHSYYSPGITSSNWGSWGAETAEFTIYEETQVRVGMISTNFAQCNGFTLTTSGAKQLLTDEIAAAPAELTEAIATAQIVYNNAGADDATYRAAAKTLNEAIVAYKIDNASEAAPVDMTSRISNPSFEGIGGATAYTGRSHNCPEWTYPSVTDVGARSATDGTYLNIDDSNDAFYCFNIWNGSAVTYTVSQTLSNMPAGVYKLTACYASDANNQATLYLNSTENGASLTATGKEHFVDGSVTYKLPVDGNLVIGLTSSAWYKADDFKLTYLGADLTDLENAFSTNYTNLQDLSTNNVPSAFASNIENLKSTYATTPTNKKGLQTANSEISAIVSAHPGIVAAFGDLTSFIELCTEYTDNQNSNANSAEVLATFQTAISTATTEGNAATSADAINAAYNTLESARQTYAQNAVPVYPYAFDMTFLLANPNFDSNIDGWTATNAGRMDAGNIECYNATFTFALANKLTGLGNGTWEVSVDGFYRYGGYNNAEAAHNEGTEELNAKLYANASEVALKSIMDGANQAGSVGATTTGGVKVPNSPADGNSYFPTGCYKNTVSTLVTDGTLTFGLKKEKTQGSDWTLFDNFRLVYKGIDVSELQTNLTTLVTSANSIKDTKMGKTERTNLVNAIRNADAEVTDVDELNEMLSALQSAYDAAVASIDTYSKVPAYITKANKIDESIAASIQTQYNEGTLEGNAETIFQNLEVATYNHVTTNFNYNVALSDTWNSTGTNTQAATFSNEHWSGETREYKNQEDGNNWGWGAQSWSIDFDQEVTLPAGEYVFKVAGRKSEGTTLELVVTMGETVLGTVNDFPSSNNTRGINKAGAASFDPEDPAGFARNGEGFGWQWRYVKFTLNAESTVKVAVHAEANEEHQWVSFGDYTLQMTEETYLEANKGGLDAPTAAAQALVNAVPMGAEEIEALEAALAMTYNTGAELLAKIEALETAIANANAWVPKYNEAKAPLVAALERFEADYNDAENGSLDYMNKNRWATAISMAQAAAVAKDVTDSYDGFATAANNLVAALDAATTSVNEYAALKSAIENANELGGGDDWGDEPFQKSESAKESFNTTKTEAQTAYNAAEVDGEGVTTVIESLNTAINKVVLNAPEEGQRYYIKVATEGHGKKDNAWLVTLGATGDNNPTGYGINANNAVKAHMPQAFIFTQVEGNLYNISIERAEGTVYLTYGALNGSAAGWKNQQIQATTDAEKKGEFKIVPTGKKGILKILNTIDNNYLDCQDGGSIYTDTGISNEEFAFELATETEVTLALSKEGWATLILPFDAELPDGVKAYSCGEVDGETLTLVEAESIKANTPYLMNGQESTHKFSGYGLADKDSYTDGLFTGTYVNYETTNDGKTYVLQNIKGEVAFYLVGEDAKPTVGAYRCYMTYEKSEEGAAQAQVFRLVRGGTTSIDNMESTDNGQQTVVIYDLMGRKVSTMEKGNMYIVNGVKVIIK